MAIGSPPPVKIPVQLNSKPAERSSKSLQGSLVKNLAPIALAAGAVALAYTGISSAISSAIDLAKESVDAAEQQEAAERRLSNAMEARGEFTREAFEANKRLAGEIQNLTAIGDDEIIQLQAQLTLMGVRSDELERATKATIGLAEITGGGLNEAAKQATKALKGDVGALKEAGIEARTVKEALVELDKGFQVVTRRTETYGGKVELLSGQWGDLHEQLGFTITQNPQVLAGLDAMSNSVTGLINAFDSKAGRDAISGLTSLLLRSTANMVDAALGLIKLRRDIRESLGLESNEIVVEVSDPKTGLTATEFEAEIEKLERAMFTQSLDFTGGTAALFDRNSEALIELKTQYEAFLKFVGDGPLQTTQAGAVSGVLDTLETLSNELRAASKKTGGPVVPKDQAGGKGGRGKGGKGSGKGAAPDIEDQISFAGAGVLGTSDNEAFEALRASNQAQIEETQAFHDVLADLDVLREEQEIESGDRLQAIRESQQAAASTFYANLASIGIGGVTGFISGIVESAATGQAKVGQAVKGMFGAILSSVGSMMIQLGTAALLGAKASTFAPWLAPVFGGPFAIPAALGLIAGGAVLQGAGAALRSTGREAAAGATGAIQTARSSDFDSSDGRRGGFRGFNDGGGRTTVNKVYLSGWFAGTEEAAARGVQKSLNDLGELSYAGSG